MPTLGHTLLASPVPALIPFPHHNLQLLSHTYFPPEALIFVASTSPSLYPSLPRVSHTHRVIPPTTSPPASPGRLYREHTGGRYAARPPGKPRVGQPLPPREQGPVHRAHAGSSCCLNLQSCLGTLSSATGHTSCFPAVWPVRTPPVCRRGLSSLSELGEEKWKGSSVGTPGSIKHIKEWEVLEIGDSF